MTELDARTAAEALQPVAASTPPADKPLDEHPPARLAEALALAVVKEQGLEGSALRRSSAELQGLLQNVVKRFQLQLAQERQREQTSTELEQLLDGLAQTNSAAGRIIAKHRGAIAKAFHGAELARMSDGIGVLSAWLRAPGEERDLLIQALLDELYAAMGATPGGQPDGPPGGQPDGPPVSKTQAAGT